MVKNGTAENKESGMNEIKEMMSAWAIIEKEAIRCYPKATPDELYQICKGAMEHALGIKKA
jgi:hypothetical protein